MSSLQTMIVAHIPDPNDPIQVNAEPQRSHISFVNAFRGDRQLLSLVHDTTGKEDALTILYLLEWSNGRVYLTWTENHGPPEGFIPEVGRVHAQIPLHTLLEGLRELFDPSE